MGSRQRGGETLELSAGWLRLIDALCRTVPSRLSTINLLREKWLWMFGTGRLIKCCEESYFVWRWAWTDWLKAPTGNMTGAWRIRITHECIYKTHWYDFYGRKSYEMMLHAQQGGDINPYAKMKSCVFSNTLRNLFEGMELVSGDLSLKVNALKINREKKILAHGRCIAYHFVSEYRLIDEMILAVHPIVLGRWQTSFSKHWWTKTFYAEVGGSSFFRIGDADLRSQNDCTLPRGFTRQSQGNEAGLKSWMRK